MIISVEDILAGSLKNVILEIASLLSCKYFSRYAERGNSLTIKYSDTFYVYKAYKF